MGHRSDVLLHFVVADLRNITQCFGGRDDISVT